MALVPGTRTCPSIPITVLQPASMISELTYGPWRQSSDSAFGCLLEVIGLDPPGVIPGVVLAVERCGASRSSI